MFRLWYFVCLLFFVININILIDESHDTIYRMVNQDQPIEYLYCFDLTEIIINKTKINTNEIKNEFNYHLRWIQKNKKDERGRLISNERIDKIINQTKSRDYLICQNRLCFIFGDRDDFESFSNLLFYLLPIYKNYFVFNNETFSFLRLKGYNSKFNQLSIQHKEYPYSKCTKDYSNFKCLNDKIKRIQPLSRYYYRSDDNESIELNYQINQTIIDNEIRVIKQCNQIDCNFNLLYPAFTFESIKLKSFLSISKLDFYLQLIGLIAFFLNIPIYRLIIKIINSIDLKPLKIRLLRIKFIKLKIKKFKKILNKLRLNRIKLLIRKYLKINNLIRSILLICLAILFSRSIYNFIEERDYPFNKTISVNLIKPELSIVICIDIKGKDYNIYNRSLFELEKESDNRLNIVLKDIYLEFLNKKIPTKWQLESKLIRFKYQYSTLCRCFKLRIFLNQPKYQTIFSVTKLIIEFNKDKYRYANIYILTDNEIFNSKSYHHFSSLNFRKRILERSKLNKIKKCKDYNQVNDNCESKSNFIDQCKTKEIYKQIKNLTQNDLIINKNYFTDKEWSNLFIEPDSISDYNKEIYRNISKECEDKYSELDPCVDIKFEYHSQINQKDSNKREINLNYEVIYHKEDEPSIFKLLLDLLNIQSNLFGLNFISFSVMILGLFRLNLKLIKIIKLFIYLLCSAGFIFHLWSIYDEIINIETIFSEHYELINSIQPPDLIFCFDFNHTKLINQNYKLTYQYLDKITSDQLRKDRIFKRIEYLDADNKWIKLNNSTNFQDDNLEIRKFYYLDRKCFKVIQKNIKFNRNQFQFNDKIEDGLVLKIYLNRAYLDEIIFYFFTKTKNKIRFSKIEKLKLYDRIIYNSFKLKHELIVRDEFELIKNPLSFLYDDDDQNDLDKFFNKLINYLDTKLNLVTFKLPINKTELNLNKELDDNLFIQLYNQKQDQNNFNTNHLRQHSLNYLEIKGWYKNFNPNLITDLEFSLSFYRKVIVVSNKISLIKLIINLLNVLSFWFDLGILDLHHYFFVFKSSPLQLYKLLIIIKNKLSSDII